MTFKCYIFAQIVKQNLHAIPRPFCGHLEYTVKWIKTTRELLKRPRKPNSRFLPDYIGFCGTVWKLAEST